MVLFEDSQFRLEGFFGSGLFLELIAKYVDLDFKFMVWRLGTSLQEVAILGQ